MLKSSLYRPAWNQTNRDANRCDNVQVGDFVRIETTKAIYNKAEVVKVEPTKVLIRYGIKKVTEWLSNNRIIQCVRYNRYDH